MNDRSHTVSVRYGEGTIETALPDCTVDVATPQGGDPVDVPAEARRALDEPHGPPLEELVTPGDEVAIVVTDVTRSTPDDVLVDAIVERLSVPEDRLTIVLGLGLHRPMTDEEIREGLGEYAEYAINHDPEEVHEVGTVDGVQVEVHRSVADADVVVSTGMVEPHQYAGFSGGAKTVVIGSGSESMIRYTHGPDMLSKEGVRLGRIEDNPFREAIDRAGDLAGPDFCVNVTHGPSGILGVSAGRPRAVVAELASIAREALSVPVTRTDYDAVVAGVPAPKDANLYQATRAATYVLLGATNPLTPGGRVVLPAALPEGAGSGAGDRRFYEWFSSATDAGSLYEAMKEGYEPGAQRAFITAKAMRDHDIYVTNTDAPEVVEECLMWAVPTIEDAIEPESRVLAVPNAIETILR